MILSYSIPGNDSSYERLMTGIPGLWQLYARSICPRGGAAGSLLSPTIFVALQINGPQGQLVRYIILYYDTPP